MGSRGQVYTLDYWFSGGSGDDEESFLNRPTTKTVTSPTTVLPPRTIEAFSYPKARAAKDAANPRVPIQKPSHCPIRRSEYSTCKAFLFNSKNPNSILCLWLTSDSAIVTILLASPGIKASYCDKTSGEGIGPVVIDCVKVTGLFFVAEIELFFTFLTIAYFNTHSIRQGLPYALPISPQVISIRGGRSTKSFISQICRRIWSNLHYTTNTFKNIPHPGRHDN